MFVCLHKKTIFCIQKGVSTCIVATKKEKYWKDIHFSFKKMVLLIESSDNRNKIKYVWQSYMSKSFICQRSAALCLTFFKTCANKVLSNLTEIMLGYFGLQNYKQNHLCINKNNNYDDITKKIRWRWISHVLRKPTNDTTRVTLRLTPKKKRW